MNSAQLLRDARARNRYHYLRGALGDGARARPIRAPTYQPVAGGERTLRIIGRARVSGGPNGDLSAT
jgi:hypothetical protein